MSTIQKILPTDFKEAISERYLAYAMSTIISRSLPDVRDGLKPVHRRLLYAMFQLKLDPKSGFKKCARVVGDVIGKYHPHGEVAVYDSLVRLAQSFSLRYPLVEGQGNFGSIDGDNAAAMRYTEARLTALALMLMEDMEHGTVPFRDSYDGSESEPCVMSARFPNILANGSEGIAVGMATSIPPHNLSELCDALLHIIKHPDCSIHDITPFVQGPDFPGGGTIIESADYIAKLYETGRGSIRVRARWFKEELKGNNYQIVITDLPYQVKKSQLIEKMAELLKDKKLPLINTLREESAEDIRIVIIPRNDKVDPVILMESLYKLTDLETRYNMNFNVLTSQSTPKVMNLLEILVAFLEHRRDVVIKRSACFHQKVVRRLEILEGLHVVYLHLDEVIRIIREQDHPKEIMQEKWGLTDIQSEAILNMRLRSLKKIEEIAVITEKNQCQKDAAFYQDILENEATQRKVIAKEIKVIRDTFGKDTELGKRRTNIQAFTPPASSNIIESFIEKEPLTVICSHMGWIRAVKGHGEMDHIKYKEGDVACFTLQCSSIDKLILITQDGKSYSLLCDSLSKAKGFGDALRVLIDLSPTQEILSLFVHVPGNSLLLASHLGKGFCIEEEHLLASTRQGKQIFTLKEKDKLLFIRPVKGDLIALIGENRKLLIFFNNELPFLKKGSGVQLQRYKSGGVSDIIFLSKEKGLVWNSGGRIRTEQNLTHWCGKRGGIGLLPPVGFPKNNKFY